LSSPSTSTPIDGLVGEWRIEADGVIAPRDSGRGAEDESQPKRQHDHGELRLPDNSSQDHRIQRVAERSGDDDRQQAADPVGQAEPGDEAERSEPPEHHDVALGKVHHFGCFVDQHEAKRDQPVDTARGCTIDDQLQYACSVFHCRSPPCHRAERPAYHW